MTLGLSASVLPSTLRGLTRFITKTTSTKFSDNDIDALLNLYYHEFVNEIIRSGGDIDFNMVTESIDLVKDQQTYTVTGKVLKLKRVEIDYANDGIFYPAITFDISQRGSEGLDTTSIRGDFITTEPFIDVYLATGEVAKVDLYPIPTAAVTNGLKVWKILEIAELSATSDEPSLPEAYQKFLAYGAAKDRFDRQGLNSKAQKMEQNMARLLSEAKVFYAERNEQTPYVLNSVYDIADGE